jgi:hypothetical protein
MIRVVEVLVINEAAVELPPKRSECHIPHIGAREYVLLGPTPG